MKRLRILHTESSLGWGGQEIRILTEAAGMIARGHAVTILSCPGSNIDRTARERGIPAVVLPIFKKRPDALLALRKWLRMHASDFDVVNTHSSTDAWLVALANATLARSLPVVRTRHVSTPVRNGAATRWLYLRATRHIVTTGERLRQQLHRDNGFPLERMTSVPTGIDLERYCPGEPSLARAALGLPDRPTVMIVATLRSWKGHADLLNAWARIAPSYRGWQLVIVGDGPQRANLEAQIATLALGESVSMCGNRNDVERWLQAADIFVLPSYGNEGVPQGIMQAMAAGLPVISTHVGAIAEAVADGRTGVLVQPRDIEALSRTLTTLMSDTGLRQSYARAGLERARTCFADARMLDAMEAIFGEAAASRA